MTEYRSVWKYLYKTPHELAWVNVGGVSTRYLEAGPKEAPVVIMLHGLMGSLENFSANIAAHARHFHVYAIDMLGCGWTDRPDYPYTIDAYVEHLRGFMDAKDIASAGIIGVSLGSATEAFFAHAHPERVDAFVMVAAAGIVVDEKEYRANMQRGVQGRLDAVDDPSWERMRSIFKGLILDESNIVDDIVGIRQDIYRDPLLKERLSHLLAPAQGTPLPHDEWKTIKTPVLIIGAPDVDNSFSRNAKLLATLLPNATLFDIRRSDHWAQFEQPDLFNPVSIEFLTRHLSKRT